MKKRNIRIFNYFKGVIYALIFISLMVSGARIKAQHPMYARAYGPEMINPVVDPPIPTPTPMSDVEKKKKLANDYKNYVKLIFGKHWKTAYAVSQAECNVSRPEWPKCKLSWAKEHSIGAFQINIAKEEGNGSKVHWDKIPGKTLEDKEKWLEDPFNNTLIAKVIFDKSGFTPWTAYINGNYKAQLDNL